MENLLPFQLGPDSVADTRRLEEWFETALDLRPVCLAGTDELSKSDAQTFSKSDLASEGDVSWALLQALAISGASELRSQSTSDTGSAGGQGVLCDVSFEKFPGLPLQRLQPRDEGPELEAKVDREMQPFPQAQCTFPAAWQLSGPYPQQMLAPGPAPCIFVPAGPPSAFAFMGSGSCASEATAADHQAEPAMSATMQTGSATLQGEERRRKQSGRRRSQLPTVSDTAAPAKANLPNQKNRNLLTRGPARVEFREGVPPKTCPAVLLDWAKRDQELHWIRHSAVLKHDFHDPADHAVRSDGNDTLGYVVVRHLHRHTQPQEKPLVIESRVWLRGTCRALDLRRWVYAQIYLQVFGISLLRENCVDSRRNHLTMDDVHEGTVMEFHLSLFLDTEAGEICEEAMDVDIGKFLKDPRDPKVLKQVFAGASLRLRGKERHFTGLAELVSRYLIQVQNAGTETAWKRGEVKGDFLPGQIFECHLTQHLVGPGQPDLHGKLVTMLPPTDCNGTRLPGSGMVCVAPLDKQKRRICAVSRLDLHPISYSDDLLHGKYRYKVLVKTDETWDSATPCRLCFCSFADKDINTGKVWCEKADGGALQVDPKNLRLAVDLSSIGEARPQEDQDAYTVAPTSLVSGPARAPAAG
ncbi:hypothetical protein AK812_SmicGene15610 [Symbiodinium microadriaticum]|uniref:Uncharacterized protein n=1 Tax=Symbiodinium microadriaticum TaxID=2951 RepID=A0A1Q9E2L9_SYMMI|nr:hypothetical protein AK812_SmicGene15610 [Symbiodinium microadriaticum]CAE7887289.1 unnamed protein product [Symbiodinium sp. KB8]